MCNSCFTSNIDSFPTQEDFEKFDLLLTKKIANDKTIKIREFVNTAWKDVGYQAYECTNCGQLWALFTPDYSDRGCLFAISNEILSKKIDPRKESKSGKKIWVVAVIILIVLIYFLA
jgi:hypothetical protein